MIEGSGKGWVLLDQHTAVKALEELGAYLAQPHTVAKEGVPAVAPNTA